MAAVQRVQPPPLDAGRALRGAAAPPRSQAELTDGGGEGPRAGADEEKRAQEKDPLKQETDSSDAGKPSTPG